ncbi:4-hydroxythreonine-4-phosphate dehydrogenase PdxA [Rhodoligotrophos defluvii]|uniref:4-hydroxythreonine-4-phosphate dehydrogenase PdxA n=1 Tax=Rhodoligotrophos defluvii TaxID=2561934 RepID=UPI0010C9472D|nr:4-hydroxythreonine-4-phosphate dehydrogenase PdxA [Rhodoligotrophos defluvii]
MNASTDETASAIRSLRPSVLALTIGEPAGIGPDIALMAWQRRVLGRFAPFVLLGQSAILADRAAALGIDVPLQEVANPGDAAEIFAEALPVLPVGTEVGVIPGQPAASAADLVIAAIRQAVDLTLAGETAAVVTNPIAKHVLYEAGFAHPGHTEFLEALAREHGYEARSVMMLTAGSLRTVPLTIHIPLRDVPQRLSQSLIVEQARIVARDLQRWFGLEHPRIAVCGLNPHAGEHGTIGSEEMETIAPAVEALRSEGLDVKGPLSADTLFHEEARAGYDVVLGMYHDQALIPVKMLGFHEGVNCTFGLPFIRTSPDHGTAFSLAGSGRANPASLIAALSLATQMASQDARPDAAGHDKSSATA